MLDRYDIHQTYDYNFDHVPAPAEVDVPPMPGTWQFLGRPVDSPLGVAAGPLLNGRWVLYYANLGFDVLTYKTVRSTHRACYPLPNLQPVATTRVSGRESSAAATSTMNGTWAVSFGMPSKSPELWRADVQWTRRQLAPEKVLSVSVVATEQPGWTLDDLANDYALTARWAVESDADVIEANFSCPNVCSSDGQLYQQAADAGRCAERIRAAIGDVPLVIKIGHLASAESAAELVDALAPYCNALAMTNSVALPVIDEQGQPLYDGQRRGICGRAILEVSLEQTTLVSKVVRQRGKKLSIIGVGGAFSAADVKRYLAAGAEAVHLATAVMVDPHVAIDIRRSY